MTKQLIGLISTDGKTAEQIQEEAWAVIERFQAERKEKEHNDESNRQS